MPLALKLALLVTANVGTAAIAHCGYRVAVEKERRQRT